VRSFSLLEVVGCSTPLQW